MLQQTARKRGHYNEKLFISVDVRPLTVGANKANATHRGGGGDSVTSRNARHSNGNPIPWEAYTL